MTTAETIVKRATHLGLHITTAESCTGGLIAAAITDIPGSSAVFDRGFVTYSNAAKIGMLGVDAASLDAQGAVSETVVYEMADGAAKAAQADIAVSVSGIAGPGGSDHKPEGRVCFGLHKKGATVTETVDFGSLGRTQVRKAATQHALALILRALETD